jgi:hypothetical protein
VYGGCKILRQMKNKPSSFKLRPLQWLVVLATGTLLFLPLAMNTYSPSWNAFLKQLPLIKNSSNLIRWFMLYIPVVILIAALMLDRITESSKSKVAVLVISILTVIALNIFTDHDFYRYPVYDPQEITSSYYKVKSGVWAPKIKFIGVWLDEKGQATVPGFRNDLLARGVSQLYCYEPIFGYGRELLPQKSLHPGPVMEEKEGILNIKNPACYVWPESNDCQPGDHFTAQQKEAAEAFTNYRPYPFHIPPAQVVANWINGLSLLAALSFLIIFCIRSASALIKPNSNA